MAVFQQDSNGIVREVDRISVMEGNDILNIAKVYVNDNGEIREVFDFGRLPRQTLPFAGSRSNVVPPGNNETVTIGLDSDFASSVDTIRTDLFNARASASNEQSAGTYTNVVPGLPGDGIEVVVSTEDGTRQTGTNFNFSFSGGSLDLLLLLT